MMKSKQQQEAVAKRLAFNLKTLEQQWAGKPIGIGFDCDLDAGRITMTIGPAGQTFNLVVTANVEDVRAGDSGAEFN